MPFLSEGIKQIMLKNDQKGIKNRTELRNDDQSSKIAKKSYRKNSTYVGTSSHGTIKIEKSF